MNLNVNKKNVKKDDGIVYLLVLHIDDKEIVKFGVTTRKIQDRVCEILTSYWSSNHKIFPMCITKRHRKTGDIWAKEKMLLDYFSDYKYESCHPFGGCTELVDVPIDIAVEYYERVLDGEILEGRYRADTAGE